MTFKKITASLLAASLLLSASVFCFADGYNKINFSKSDTTQITNEGAEYTRFGGSYDVGNNSYLQSAHLFTSPLDKKTRIVISNNGSVYGKSTVKNMASGYSNEENTRVLLAINADFFSSSTGIALGVQIIDGRLVQSNNGDYDKAQRHYAIGFKEDGSAVFGIPEIQICADFASQELEVDRINSYPDSNIVVLNSDYASKTYWSQKAHTVAVLKIHDANKNKELKTKSSILCNLEAVFEGVTEPIDIKEGYLYLVSAYGDERTEFLKDIPLGSGVAINTTEKTGKWNDVRYAVSGGDLLVDDGKIVSPAKYDGAISKKLASRTAIGIKPDGSVAIFCAERDKDAIISSGVYLETVAQHMYDLGCQYAINLDGGGSSTFMTYANGECFTRNNLQDGEQRRVSNALLVVYDAEFEPKTDVEDDVAPSVSVGISGSTYYAAVSDELLGSRLDKENSLFTIDGKKVTPECYRGVFKYNTDNLSPDKVHLARIEVVDYAGNRTRKSTLVKNNAYAQPMPFADVTDGSWDATFIRYCYENGFIGGMPSGDALVFMGSSSITREQFCTMLVKRAGLDPTLYQDVVLPYTDASEVSDWALNFVKAAYAENIMVGDGITFKPTANITRAEAACAAASVMLRDPTIKNTVSFIDFDSVPDWAKGAVTDCAAEGVFGGDPEGRFNPQNNITRSETAVIMSQIILKTVEK